jgi:hypothetical protein
MERKDVTSYLVTLPERLVRSAVGLGAGLAREVGDLVLPESVRQGQLYQNMVATTLRFLIEQVGGAERRIETGRRAELDQRLRVPSRIG